MLTFQNTVWVIKEQEDESVARSEKADILEEVSQEEKVAPGAASEKEIKELGVDSGGRSTKVVDMGAVANDISKVVADALEHLIEEHDYTNTRTWVNNGNSEKEGKFPKQESIEEWEDPSRWEFVTVKKSEKMIGSKIVDKLEVGEGVKMSAQLGKAAEEIVDDFLTDVEKELEFERTVEQIFSQHAEVIDLSAKEDVAQYEHADEDVENQTEKVPEPAEKGSSNEVEKHTKCEVNLKHVKEMGGVDLKAMKVNQHKAGGEVHEDKNAKKDAVMTEDKGKEQKSSDLAAFLECSGCLQSVSVVSGVFSCLACEGFRLCTDCKEIGAKWWVGGGCRAPRFSSMPVHDLVKVTQLMLSSSDVSINQTQDNSTKPDYRLEEDRLASFAQWSVRFIKPADLAKAGFYSLKSLDKCRCAFCHSRVEDWVEGDQPMKEHAKLCPECPFVLGREVGNVPITWLSAIRKMESQAKENQAKATQLEEDHQVRENQAQEDQGKEDQVKENQAKENQVKGNYERRCQGEKARNRSTKRMKRSKTVGGRVDLQKLLSKEEEGRHCEPRSSEYVLRAVEMEAEVSAVKLNFENQNNNEEHWEELQKLSQRELLEDPDFLPFKPKKPRKSAPPITPVAPAMMMNSSPNVLKESSLDVSKKSSLSVPKKARKSEKLAGEVDRVADTRCTKIPVFSRH